MANKPLNTELLDRAIVFAVKAHAGTERRGKGFPYIIHPMEAVEIVATITPDQELLAAAALHDTVEDTDVTIQDIRREFGDRIASLVQTESVGDDEGTWHERKKKAIDLMCPSGAYSICSTNCLACTALSGRVFSSVIWMPGFFSRIKRKTGA